MTWSPYRRLTYAELNRLLDDAPQRVFDHLGRSGGGMDKAILTIEDKAIANCSPGTSPYYKAPYDTGNMRQSIGSKIIVKRKMVQGIVFVGKTAPYSVYVHEGTYRMVARPFLLDAFKMTRDECIQLIGDDIRKTLKEMCE